MSSGIPSLTILSEEQKFNGENLLQWNTNITQLLASKGLLGYISGQIPKPTQDTTAAPQDGTTATATTATATTATATASVTTPIYSSAPTLDEWVFRDQLTRGHITLNCTDVACSGSIKSN